MSSAVKISNSILGNVPASRGGPGGQAEVDGLNARVIDPLPRREPKPKYFIFNVSDHRYNPRLPISWVRNMGGFGMYYIWAREENELVSKPTIVVEPLYEQYDDGIPGGWGGGNLKGRVRFREEDSLLFAQDILGIRPPITADNDLTEWGVFMSERSTPLKAEITAATEKMEHTYEGVLQHYDRLWENPQQRNQIDWSLPIRAAKHMKQEKPYSTVSKKMIACPGCGAPVQPHVAYHAGPNGCGTIVNLEAARRLREQEKMLDAQIEKKSTEAKG